MRVSLRWLNDYIEVQDLTAEQLAATLTQLGLEVEGIETIAPLQGPVVIGQIIKAIQHPNADKLQVCQVSIGGDALLQIVCGAPNARAGLKVAVACSGAVLPQDFKIKNSKIRGEDSAGMLCSEKELSLSEAQDGILELPADAPLGTSLSDFFGMNDTVIEVSVTPNRSDCLGIIGIARDLAAKLQRPLKIPVFDPQFLNQELKTADQLTVNVLNSEAAPGFVALYLRNVSSVASPHSLRQRLLHAGLRPINLIVDATNYVMLESGQPIHAYDERSIKGRQIIVRSAKVGESLATLDGQSRPLLESDIVIADAEAPIGLAGIMGGANSEIKSDTKNIFIEVAQFDSIAIRKTAKRLALHTDASHRFERGVDGLNLAWVARRTAEFIATGLAELSRQGHDLAVPEIAGLSIEILQASRPLPSIALRLPRLRKITALSSISREEVTVILNALGFSLIDSTDQRLLFAVPSWRHDIEREVDLIEEVARVYGFDKIPKKMPLMQISVLPEHPLINFIDQCKSTLADVGLSEVITFPFMSQDDFTKLGITGEHPLAAAVKLANPLVEQHSHMRSTLIPGLIACVLENRRHGQQGVKLFEVARSFHEPKRLPSDLAPAWKHLGQQGDHIPSKARQDDRPIERSRIAGILDQPWSSKRWNQVETKANFFHGKQVLWQWLAAFGISDLKIVAINAEDFPYLHPGAAATLWTSADIFVGCLGELHPKMAKAYDIDFNHPPVVFELDLEPLLLMAQSKQKYLTGTAKFPPIVRDFAFMVANEVSYNDFLNSFAQFKQRKFLKESKLFDVYQGPNLPEGKKSMAFSLSFQTEDRTLTEKDVEKEIEALLSQLKEDLSAELR